MKRLAIFATILLIALGGSTSALARDIGFVDMKRVLAESRQGKAVQEKIRSQFEKPRQALLKEEKEIAQAQKDLQRDAATMSKEQVTKKENKIRQRIASYQERGRTLQQGLVKAQESVARDVLEPASKVLDAIAKEKNLAMIVERGTTGLLYLDDALNLTEEVIKRMAKAK